MQTVRTKNNGNRFIEQYEWTIYMCITVQIGERGKQRVKINIWTQMSFNTHQ